MARLGLYDVSHIVALYGPRLRHDRIPNRRIMRFSTPPLFDMLLLVLSLIVWLLVLLDSERWCRDNKGPLVAWRLLVQQQSHRLSSARTHKLIVRSMNSPKGVCSLSLLLRMWSMMHSETTFGDS